MSTVMWSGKRQQVRNTTCTKLCAAEEGSGGGEGDCGLLDPRSAPRDTGDVEGTDRDTEGTDTVDTDGADADAASAHSGAAELDTGTLTSHWSHTSAGVTEDRRLPTGGMAAQWRTGAQWLSLWSDT